MLGEFNPLLLGALIVYERVCTGKSAGEQAHNSRPGRGNPKLF